MYRRALVPLDGSPDSAAVTDRLSSLLAPDGEAILLHVLPEPPSAGKVSFEGWLALQREAEEYLSALPVSGFKGSVRTFVDVGDPGERILAIASSTKPDLIALATHAWRGVPRAGLGRVARHVLREAVGPVYFVPPGTRPWTGLRQRILLPLEGPGWSRPEVEPILELVAGTEAEVVLLHVEPPEADPLEGRRTDAPLELAAHDRERLYREAADHLRSFGVEARSVLTRGEPVGQILDLAESLPVSMIALMTHGRRGLERLLAGSVTERVIAYSERPVLLLRPSIAPESELPEPGKEEREPHGRKSDRRE